MRCDPKRGALFEASALDYDLYRPGYPAEVICKVASLAALRSTSRLLEIGCGTGKATVPFASRGFMIDYLDPGEKLLAFARQNCRAWPNASFRRATFEEVRLEARHYDLVYSAQAFHWVDPSVRMRKAAHLLAENGSLALMYNYPANAGDGVLKLLSSAVQEESGGKMKAWDYTDEISTWSREIDACGLFRGIELFRHRWEHRYSAERYTGLFRTYSDFLSLSRSTQARVLRRIREIIQDNGGYVRRPYDCVLIHARRNKAGQLTRP
jgi:SAM-dependent methyltransferase